jgi:tetratricopeptide (TPR) repeat protein
LAHELRKSDRCGEAREHVDIALRRHPDSGEAHFELGSLHAQLGDMAQAEQALRTAWRLQPELTTAQTSLVRLLAGRLPDTDVRAIEQRLADPQLPENCRTQLLYALASVHDARGDFAHAAACARQANTLRREQCRRQQADYDPHGYHRFIDELQQAFDADFFRRTAGAGLATPKPVFVLGLPRSGTTLVEQILASHSRVHGAGELSLAWKSFMAIPGALGRCEDPLTCVPALDAPALRGLAERHLARLHTLPGAAGADRIIDKLPDNYHYLGLLAALFPQATFIHCRRDLRDVAVSCWITDFQWLNWTTDAGDIAGRFHEYTRLMEHWRRVLPVPLVEVDYEEVVADLEGSARRLVSACGLDWQPACLDFHKARRPVRTASAAQVRSPLYRHAAGRWKNYEAELAELLALLSSR